MPPTPASMPETPYPLWKYTSDIMTINPDLVFVRRDGRSQAHGWLTRWGNDGWELCAMVPTGRPNEWVVYFKRPMQPDEWVDLSA
jgi:hypothetical protein